MATVADQLEVELDKLQRQRDRYALAADAAKDPKMSIGHLRNVERLEEEIEALQKALAALPMADGAGRVQVESDLDGEQTRIFDPSDDLPSDSTAPWKKEQRFSRPLESGVSPFDVPPSGPIALDLPTSALRRASTYVLVVLVLGAAGVGLWWVSQPDPTPTVREGVPSPTVIEAAPIPTDVQQR